MESVRHMSVLMLHDLRLHNFRCFAQMHFQPEPGSNFIIGANAQGKTSLLEAACILLRLQSPKASSLAETLRFDQTAFGLDGYWNEHHLRLKFSQGLKAFALDSKAQSRTTDYLSVARVAWIGNDDLQLIRGSGSSRRRYLDFLGAQVEPRYLRALRAYERALRSRNALLKEQRPRREIEAFDPPLVEAGQTLLDAREELCRILQPLVTEAYGRISGGREVLSLDYRPGASSGFAQALSVSREDEMRLRVTTVGPHRDDFEILLAGRKTATFASEGQQRSAALALKLGQASALGQERPPLYLIDDVFGELDPTRRNNLMAALPTDAQKIITSTSLTWMEETEPAAIFHLNEGALTRRD